MSDRVSKTDTYRTRTCAPEGSRFLVYRHNQLGQVAEPPVCKLQAKSAHSDYTEYLRLCRGVGRFWRETVVVRLDR
ncbi:hypothetical protein PROFUN_04399 [Planoprotostelium fungivorum]|uniref:Uncharacterized protein n=1 Tax=Planoprotostelium fungivorum TaxID=1890364 RepID=A0A2P6NHT7_9EUKA|nr:hypothetical protein PROFUN_04399 [Planoprotostelium fungivorum]